MAGTKKKYISTLENEWMQNEMAQCKELKTDDGQCAIHAIKNVNEAHITRMCLYANHAKGSLWDQD